MRSKSAKQVLPVEMNEQSLEISRSGIGPMVVMSGYLTKKARSRSRWLHRWYQLLDNGILQYFLDDKKVKLLGEIDVGRTCYDVRDSTKNSGITFPRVAPRCCCFWFVVLKRTYYMYAPTAMEARKWFESIRNASNILNRRVVAGVKRRKAPEAPGPARPSSTPLNFRISMTPVDASMRYKQRATSLQDVHRIRVKDDSAMSRPLTPDVLKELTQASRVYSVPDCLDRIGMTSPFDTGTEGWLIDSPPPDPTTFSTPFNNTSLPIVAVAGGSFGSSTHCSDMEPVATAHDPTLGSTSPQHSVPLRRRPHSLPDSLTNAACLSGEEEPMPKLPPRPASLGTYPKSYQVRPQPRPRARCSTGVTASSENGLLSKTKAVSRSTEILFNGNSQERAEPSTVQRPVPKPRKQKEAIESEVEPPLPQRHSKVTFSDHPSIINIACLSDSDSSDSVSLTTGSVHKSELAVDIEDFPPPRPRKNSGPPRFVPPPPPKEDKEDSVTIHIL